MELNTIAKKVAAGILLILFCTLVIQFVNPMLEKISAKEKSGPQQSSYSKVAPVKADCCKKHN
jgi:hypothetical protein